MTGSSFFLLVPKPVRLAAWIIMAAAVLFAVGGTLYSSSNGGTIYWSPSFAVAAIAGGLFLSTWLVGLGYVHADARRRAMRPVLWVLVASLFPHLLGFLLYFVLRQPLSAPCPQCGSVVPSGQRFCSRCGSPLGLPVAPTTPGIGRL